MNAGITLLPAFEKREELIPLYQEYADMLVRVEPIFTRSLEQQNYDEEIARLEEKYAPPRGSIYLVYVEDELAGCVGMKPSDTESAELKRLYVRPAFRGQNLGELLTRRIMDDARAAGYRLARQKGCPVHQRLFLAPLSPLQSEPAEIACRVLGGQIRAQR